MKFVRLSLYLLLLPLFFSGCAWFDREDSAPSAERPTAVSAPATTESDGGTIVISRAMPGLELFREGASALGFTATPLTRAGRWLGINRSEKKVNLMEGDTPLFSIQAEGLDSLEPGEYQVLHKQKNALWYASDGYFERRGLPAPAVGDRTRYLRGALGEYSIFLGKDLPIHSGPFWNSEIGGVRVSESELSRLYYSVAVGTAVQVD